jgi:hypothetical protein
LFIFFQEAHFGVEDWGRKSTEDGVPMATPKRHQKRKATNRKLGVCIERPIAEQSHELKLVTLQGSGLVEALRVQPLELHRSSFSF